MRYPCLVRKRDCKTAVKVHLEPEGIGVYGEPLPALDLDLTCNYHTADLSGSEKPKSGRHGQL